jgi:hypothetical protein
MNDDGGKLSIAVLFHNQGAFFAASRTKPGFAGVPSRRYAP